MNRLKARDGPRGGRFRMIRVIRSSLGSVARLIIVGHLVVSP